MFRKILVPLDNSPFGEQALPLALDLARRSGAFLQVAHVHEMPIDGYPFLAAGFSLELEVRRQDEAYLLGVLKRLRAAAPKVPMSSALLEMTPVADTLAGHVEREGFDLVVMATHGRGTLGRMWFGAVADGLARHSPAPVLLVRPGEATGSLEKPPLLKRWLIPLDGSPLAEQALEPAVQLGSLYDAEYALLRVVQPVVHPLYLPEGRVLAEAATRWMDQIDQLQQQTLEVARRQVEEAASNLRARGLGVKSLAMVNEEVAAAILHTARDQADALAVATHGRGLSRLFRGSVAEKIVRGATQPVLVYRPRKEG